MEIVNLGLDLVLLLVQVFLSLLEDEDLFVDCGF